MILFLIELYLLGFGIAVQFRDKLPDFLLSLLAVLLGFFAYFFNVLILTLFQVNINAGLIGILQGIEILGLLGFRLARSKQKPVKFGPSLFFYLASGGIFVVASWVFLNKAFIFASPDSLYMIIIAKGILETGFSQWYFASPLLWGMFVPILQTIGLLFGFEYTWFVQPVISLTFLVLFVYLTFRATYQISGRKWFSLVLSFLGAGLLLSANMYWVAQFYIHTNLNSGISLWLVMISLYFAVKEKNDAWLGIAGIFLVMFGMLRIENVIMASLLIVLVIASQKLSRQQVLATFLPYLLIQILWNIWVLIADPVAFSNLMNTTQLAMVTGALLALVLFLLLSGKRWVQEKLAPNLNAILLGGLLFLLVGLFIRDPYNMAQNTWDNLTTMFVSGKWLTTFWAVVVLLFLVRPKEKLVLQPVFNVLIVGFFSMIVILGAIKGGYHKYWYDSANRMYIHILPTMVTYLMLRISAFYSEKPAPRQTS